MKKGSIVNQLANICSPEDTWVLHFPPRPSAPERKKLKQKGSWDMRPFCPGSSHALGTGYCRNGKKLPDKTHQKKTAANTQRFTKKKVEVFHLRLRKLDSSKHNCNSSHTAQQFRFDLQLCCVLMSPGNLFSASPLKRSMSSTSISPWCCHQISMVTLKVHVPPHQVDWFVWKRRIQIKAKSW